MSNLCMHLGFAQNNRDSTIVPQLAELDGTCDIYFPDIIYSNSGYVRPLAVDAILNVTRSAKDPTQAICAVLGPTQPRSNEGVSALTENLWIPQLAYSTIDVRLSRREDFPTLARTITSSQDYGFAIANFLQRDILDRQFLAIIYDISDYGEQYEDPLEDAEEFLEYTTITEHIIEGNRESIEDSLGTTKEDGYHTMLLATDRIAVLDDVADVADEIGLLGNDYLWFISGDMLTPSMVATIKYKVDSPADKLLRGAAVFTNYDPFVYYGEDDPFLKSWRAQDPSLLDRVRELHPMVNDPDEYMGEDDYFLKETPTEYASFLYDSIIATGISACKAKASPKTDHVAEMFLSDFQGASGYFQFTKTAEDEKPLNGRDISGVVYGMYNVRPDKVDENNMQSYKLVLTHLYTNETQVTDSEMPVPGSWFAVEGAEFIFYDGTTNPPMPLKTTIDYNYLSHSVHVLGLFLMSIAFVIAIGSGVWVYVRREDTLVKAAQPEFLYLLCFGSGLLALSLFFISWDEDKGATQEQLSAFCSGKIGLAV